MSVNIDLRVLERGDNRHVKDAWELKEQVRREDGALKQRKGFFTDAYRRSTVYILVENGHEETLVGFAAVRRDGYILFLAVHPAYRGEGHGRRLVAEVANDHSTVTCHARTTNDLAIGFYQALGFEIERRVDNYYEDNGDAYYLRLGEGGIASKLSKFMRR